MASMRILRKCIGSPSTVKRRSSSTDVGSLNDSQHRAKRATSKRSSPPSSKQSIDRSETLPTFEATANKAQLGVSQPAVSRRVQQSTTCRPSLLSSQTTTRSELPFSAFEERERDISPDDSHPGHSEEEDRYEVETILAKKGRGPTAQYLVKWLGYEEVTWLPAGELDQSVELVDEFEKRDKEKKELALSTTEATRKRVYADQQPKGNFAVPRRSHQEPAGPFSNGLIPTSNGPLTSVPKYPRQMHFDVAQLGQSGVEKGHNVVKILAHKPKELIISRLEDVDFLVNYAGESSNEFVEYEVCIRQIPVHVAEYLARVNPLL